MNARLLLLKLDLMGKVGCGFKPRPGKTTNFTTGIFWFSAKYAASRINTKTG